MTTSEASTENQCTSLAPSYPNLHQSNWRTGGRNGWVGSNVLVRYILCIWQRKYHGAGSVPRTLPGVKAYRLSVLSCSKATAGRYNHGRGLPGGIPREGGREGDVAWLRKIIKLKENGQINITKFLSFSIIYQVFQKQ